MNFENGTRSEVFDCAFPVGIGMRFKEIWRRCDPNGSSALCGNKESKSPNGNQRYGQNRPVRLGRCEPAIDRQRVIGDPEQRGDLAACLQ